MNTYDIEVCVTAGLIEALYYDTILPEDYTPSEKAKQEIEPWLVECAKEVARIIKEDM